MFEGDVLRTELTLAASTALADGGLLDLQAIVFADRADAERRARTGPRLALRGVDGMTGILAGMRVVEGSAFVAAPLGGMTLAQLGADVIRFDPIGGGLDYNRWPITDEGKSLFWPGLNKGKRSIQIDLGTGAGAS